MDLADLGWVCSCICTSLGSQPETGLSPFGETGLVPMEIVGNHEGRVEALRPLKTQAWSKHNVASATLFWLNHILAYPRIKGHK